MDIFLLGMLMASFFPLTNAVHFVLCTCACLHVGVCAGCHLKCHKEHVEKQEDIITDCIGKGLFAVNVFALIVIFPGY